MRVELGMKTHSIGCYLSSELIHSIRNMLYSSDVESNRIAHVPPSSNLRLFRFVPLGYVLHHVGRMSLPPFTIAAKEVTDTRGVPLSQKWMNQR